MHFYQLKQYNHTLTPLNPRFGAAGNLGSNVNANEDAQLSKEAETQLDIPENRRTLHGSGGEGRLANSTTRAPQKTVRRKASTRIH